MRLCPFPYDVIASSIATLRASPAFARLAFSSLHPVPHMASLVCPRPRELSASHSLPWMGLHSKVSQKRTACPGELHTKSHSIAQPVLPRGLSAQPARATSRSENSVLSMLVPPSPSENSVLVPQPASDSRLAVGSSLAWLACISPQFLLPLAYLGSAYLPRFVSRLPLK